LFPILLYLSCVLSPIPPTRGIFQIIFQIIFQSIFQSLSVFPTKTTLHVDTYNGVVICHNRHVTIRGPSPLSLSVSRPPTSHKSHLSAYCHCNPTINSNNNNNNSPPCTVYHMLWSDAEIRAVLAAQQTNPVVKWNSTIGDYLKGGVGWLFRARQFVMVQTVLVAVQVMLLIKSRPPSANYWRRVHS
jgi:hypothetical protein